MSDTPGTALLEAPLPNPAVVALDDAIGALKLLWTGFDRTPTTRAIIDELESRLSYSIDPEQLVVWQSPTRKR